MNIITASSCYGVYGRKYWGMDVLLRFYAGEFHQLAGEHINADDVMTFCLYLMNKIRRSCASFSWFKRFYRFLLLLDG